MTANPDPLTIKWCAPNTSDPLWIGETLHKVSSALPDPLVDRVDVTTYARKLCERADIAIARFGGSPAGFLAGYLTNGTGGTAFISILVVFDEFRSRGIGGRLISATVQRAQENAIQAVWLKVHPQNLRAQKFYLKHGFIFDDKVDGKIRMTLHL